MSRFRDLMRYKRKVGWHFRVSPDGEPATFNDYFKYQRSSGTGRPLYIDVDFSEYKCYVNNQRVSSDYVIQPNDIVRLDRRINKKNIYPELHSAKVNICELLDPCPYLLYGDYLFEGCKFLKHVTDDLFIKNPYMNFIGTFLNSALESIPEKLFQYVKVSNIGAYKGPDYRETFSGTQITEYPYGLLKDGNSFTGVFKNCLNLLKTVYLGNSVKELPKHGGEGAQVNSMFEGCISLTDVSEETFDDIQITSSTALFKGCVSLETIPDRLFKNVYVYKPLSPSGISWGEIFMNCTSLKQIPETLFNDVKPSQISLLSAFRNTGITQIPVNLIKNYKELYSTNYMFSECKNLTYVDNIFENNNTLSNITGMFEKCSNLTSIASDFLNGVRDSIAYAMYMFEFSGLQNVEDGFFANCPLLTDISYAFGYTKITKAPDKIIENSPVQKVSGLFTNILTLTEVPDTVFKGGENITTVNSLFNACSRITSIGPIFAECPNITNFAITFSNTRLTSIPEDLFVNNKEATTFEHCFTGNNLTSIPSGLFRNNTKVTNFASTFSSALQTANDFTIPSQLFINCPEVTTFNGCFYRNVATIPSDLFDNNNKVTDFSGCFKAFTPYAIAQGTAPTLWTRSNVTSFKECFKYQTNLTNYESIPADWK